MQPVYKRIRLSILVFMVILSLFIFTAIYRPLTKELNNEVMENYQLITENKHQVLKEYVKKGRDSAASLSSRSVIRDMLADYLDGKVSLEDLKEFTAPRYNDGAEVIENLRSALRVTPDGKLIHTIGQEEGLIDFVQLEKEELFIEYKPDEDLLFVQSPVKKDNKILGFDVIITDAGPVVAELEKGGYQLTFIDEMRNSELIVADGRIYSYMKCSLLNGMVAISNDESVVFDDIHKLTIKTNIRYFIGLLIMFLIIHFFNVRYVRKFFETQQALKEASEEREKEKNILYTKLKDSEELLSMIIDVTGEGLWDWHIDEGIVYHNKRWCTIMGLDEGFLSHNMEEYSDRLHPDDREEVLKLINQAVETQEEYYNEHRMISNDGSVIWVVDRGTVVKNNDGKAQRMIGSIANITLRKKAQLELFLEKEAFQSTLLSVGDGIVSTDVEGNILVLNPAAEKLIGCKQSEVIGKKVDEVIKLIYPETREKVLWENSMDLINKETKAKESVLLLISQSGDELTIFENIDPVNKPNGETTGFVMIFRDMTDLFEKQKKIQYMSFHDVLTGLYNRRYMEDAMRRLDTNRNLPFAIMMLDLNNLKLTNDVFGHEMGDSLIKKTADFLRDIFRADDIISRIGGDEFCILMPKTSLEASKTIKQRIKNTSENYSVGPLCVSTAAGCCVKTLETEKIDDILRDADTNMYEDKQANRQKVKSSTIERFIKTNREKSEAEHKHNEQVGILAAALYEALGKSEAEISAFRKTVQVHDIGKIVIPGELLNKKEVLTGDDWDLLKRHSYLGYQILSVLKEHEAFADAILYHHERIDGNGYPEGLKGDAIPLESKVIAVADAFEAMTADRPYRKAMSKEQAVAELRSNAGTQFDVALVQIFIDKVLVELS